MSTDSLIQTQMVLCSQEVCPGSVHMRLRRSFFGNSTQSTPLALNVQVPGAADMCCRGFGIGIKQVE